MPSKYTLDFSQIRMTDVALVGGKNASLGELYCALSKQGVGVLDGFAVTTEAYWRVLDENGLRQKLEAVFAGLNAEDLDKLTLAGHTARSLILQTPLPDELRHQHPRWLSTP